VAVDELKIAVVGDKDHGKSTLVGRMLLENDHPAEADLSADNGVEEAARVTDQLAEEREGALTLDTAQATLRTSSRALVLIDTPGHEELLTNTLSGIGWADVGLVVVDGTQGPTQQTRRHLRSLAVLGVKQAMTLINKMDQLRFNYEAFESCAGAAQRALHEEGLGLIAAVPGSALKGDNITLPSWSLRWFQGPPLLQILENTTCHNGQLRSQPRDKEEALLVVQATLEREGKTYALGRIDSGRFRIGDGIWTFSGEEAHQLQEIWVGNHRREHALAGERVGLVTKGPQDVKGGDLLVTKPDSVIQRREMWLRGIGLSAAGLSTGQSIQLERVSDEHDGQLVSVEKSSPASPGGASSDTDALEPAGGLISLLVRCHRPVPFFRGRACSALDRVVIYRDGKPVAVATADLRYHG